MARTARSKNAHYKRRQRTWLTGCGLVILAGIVVAGTAELSHRGGDPGGVRQKALRTISAAVPHDATIQVHSEGGPVWDSCDGRPGTQGWSDVSNTYQFASPRSPETVVASAQAALKRDGWAQVSTSASPLGPAILWTKAISGDVIAQVQLSIGSRGPATPSYWDFTASAPPEGRRASGC